MGLSVFSKEEQGHELRVGEGLSMEIWSCSSGRLSEGIGVIRRLLSSSFMTFSREVQHSEL